MQDFAAALIGFFFKDAHMRKPIALAGLIVGFGMGFGLWWMDGASSAIAGNAIVAPAAALVLPTIGEGDFEFVGSAKCKKCHIKEHKSWDKTKHGQAMETLKAGQAVEAKTKFKLDPQKDYTKDSVCLACHTVGFGKKGGYSIPPDGDEKAVKQAKALENVGCESCHGPGSRYNEVFEEIMKSKRKYKPDELYAVGLTKIEAGACTVCHNEKGPTHDPSKPFDFAKMKENPAGIHEHLPLQQRE
jgi:hypothetical protein